MIAGKVCGDANTPRICKRHSAQRRPADDSDNVSVLQRIRRAHNSIQIVTEKVHTRKIIGSHRRAPERACASAQCKSEHRFDANTPLRHEDETSNARVLFHGVCIFIAAAS
jgi:hypothetical protein